MRYAIVQSPSPTVVVLNDSADLVELIQLSVRRCGFSVRGAAVPRDEATLKTVRNLIAQERPLAVLYDLVPPYAADLEFFKAVAREFLEDETVMFTSSDAVTARRSIPLADPIWATSDIEGIARHLQHLRQPQGPHLLRIYDAAKVQAESSS